jgi:nucleotide-binding universal stress UspA family protein
MLANALDADVLAVGVSHAQSMSMLVGERMAEQLGRAEEQHVLRYLSELKDKQTARGRHIETELRRGDPVDEVLNILNERGAQYLVLATHGRSGVNRWRYGSVASRLIREAPVPTLVIGQKTLESDQEDVHVRRILVPLDGSSLSEAALPAASELAAKLGASLVLARGVQWASQVYPSFDPITLNRALDESAAAYLDQVREQNAGVVEMKVLRGYPADALIQLVSDAQIDLVVMTSHSRAGLTRAVLGSVADRMLQCAAPVLLVRPEKHAGRAAPGESTGTAAVRA